MFEKVNPSHPDKVADRIGGAMLDLAYKKSDHPILAGELLIGHGKCHIITETNVHFTKREVKEIVNRIIGKVKVDYLEVPQDSHLAENQSKEIRCGDNGIFKGVPLTDEQKELSFIARRIYEKYSFDGKYIISDLKCDETNRKNLVICQSNAKDQELRDFLVKDLNLTEDKYNIIINPLGEWIGSINVDCGCTNRKLGSDMADSVTGGGLCFKDCSKADVSVNIYCFLKAQELNKEVKGHCAIGDTNVKIIIDNEVKLVPYKNIVEVAMNYINNLGGFEKFTEWGLC